MSNLIGQSLGRYHILEQLGEGGMAIVYKARDTNLDRDVAIKVIRTDIFGPAILKRLLERFKREGQALAKLTHPNIVTVLEYGEHEGAPYLVMPYLPGGTLKSRINKPIPYQDAVRLLIPIAQALAHAHEQGIIHRDVKPANILITRTGEPMLSDFGIAKLLDTEETRELTGTGVGIGTPEYMAPEQGMGQSDERADIYALGIVFYELVTGRIPYRADTPMAILMKKSQEPLPRPKSFVPSLPDSVENVLIKVLARDPDNRYQTAREFADALERLARGETITREISKSSKPNSTWLWAGLGALGFVVLAICLALGMALRSFVFPASPTMDASTQAAETATLLILTTETASPPIPPPSLLPVSTTTPSPLPASARVNSRDEAEMILIPAAAFVMGLSGAQADILLPACDDCKELLSSSQPQHTVQLDAYWIYKTEVSNDMYRRCAQAGECAPPVRYNSETRGSYYDNPDFGNYPVVFVTWYAAQKYCQWAGGNLPTEAQWEYAARGAQGNLYPWGDRLPNKNLANVANLQGDTTSVDAYPEGASPFGLLNMTGNVWEWVFDWYQADYYRANTNWNNPTGPETGESRAGDALKVGRGGSYWISAGASSAGVRDWYQALWAGSAVGFRCVQSP